MWDKMFFYADEEAILKGRVADVYFQRGKEILKKKGVDPVVYGEITASDLPPGYEWGILSGTYEAVKMLEGKPITVKAMPEGSLFYSGEPVFSIEGKYTEFGVYETAFLGFLCHSSGISTKAARVKKAAKGKPVFSFGARRMHPTVAPAIERSAYIGTCDGVAAIESARAIGEQPVGTMAHAYIICYNDPIEAYKAFDEIMPEEIKRIALIDTFDDEKFGSIEAARTLNGKLFAVRLDTPGSRRGNFKQIIKEVRWELDLRGYKDVKIFLSGGLDEYSITELVDVADAFGVGTSISNAKVIDFAFDLVEREGKPSAKRGKLSGKKQVYECQSCLRHYVMNQQTPLEKCKCGGEVKPLLIEIIKNGKIMVKLDSAKQAQKRAKEYLTRL